MVLIPVLSRATMPRMIRVDGNGIILRPRPPAELVALTGRNLFEPAPELVDWIEAAYLSETGMLFTSEHGHLPGAKIACLWTNCENSRQQRRIVGQAEIPPGPPRGGKWARARVEFQLEQWFGDIPDFLLTFDALYANDIDDATFCALVDHELFHCAQDTDEDDGLYVDEIELPTTWVVCDVCDGKGTHVNPSIDCGGISPEAFAADPDFAEDYFGGTYDQTCNRCKGRTTVRAVDWDALTAEQRTAYEAQLQSEHEDRACYLAEMRMGA